MGQLAFTKMHGIGNDYVYINCMERVPEDPGALARFVSERHYGIGSDGLVLILPPDVEGAQLRMRMFNADGSEAEMCGNASRCVAKYAYEHGLLDKETRSFTLQTGAGLKPMELVVQDGTVTSVCVDMGAPIFEPERIPVAASFAKEGPCVARPLMVEGKEYLVTALSMGNPHAVLFLPEVASLDLEAIGPFFENHVAFPKRINTEFVCVKDPKHIEMRVYERGSGETLACGTGACASVVACVLNGKTEEDVQVDLKGGTLSVNWRNRDHVFLTGPAVTVFEGTLFLPASLG